MQLRFPQIRRTPNCTLSRCSATYVKMANSWAGTQRSPMHDHRGCSVTSMVGGSLWDCGSSGSVGGARSARASSSSDAWATGGSLTTGSFTAPSTEPSLGGISSVSGSFCTHFRQSTYSGVPFSCSLTRTCPAQSSTQIFFRSRLQCPLLSPS